jgi:hypothetical protein
MKILVDGKRQDMRPLPKTMGNLIADLRTAVTNAGRIVLKVSVDGRELSEGDEAKIASHPISGFGTVAVATSDPKTLCVSTLEEVSRHIQPVIDECERIANLIDAGKELAALERILPCIEVWGAILATVQKVSILMHVNVSEVSADNEGLSEAIAGVGRLLGGLKTSIDSHDIVSVRDAMKYEMPEIAKRVAGQIQALSAAIAAK